MTSTSIILSDRPLTPTAFVNTETTEAIKKVPEVAKKALEDVKEKVGEAVQGAKGRVGKALEDVKEGAEKVKERALTAYEQMPYLAEDSDEEEAGKTEEVKDDKKEKKKASKEDKADKSEKKEKKKAAKEGKAEKKEKKNKEEAPQESKAEKVEKKDKKKAAKEGKVEKTEGKDEKSLKVIVKSTEAPESAGIFETFSKYLLRPEKPEKVKNKEPFGVKHTMALLFGMALTLGISIQMSLFALSSPTSTPSPHTVATTIAPQVSNSIFAGAMMGAWLDFIRVAYKSIPQKALVITMIRITAFISLIASILFNNLLPKDSLWNALPLFAFSIAILIKCEWNKMKPEKFLTDRFGWGKDRVQVASAAVQGLIATTMTAPNLPAMMQAPAAVIAKAKFRTCINEGFKYLTSIYHFVRLPVLGKQNLKKLALGVTYVTLPIMGALSLLALRNDWMDNKNNPTFFKSLATMGLNTVSIVAFDTVARLFKNFLWKFAEAEGRPQQQALETSECFEIKMAKAFGKNASFALLHLGAILGVSYLLQQLLVTQTFSPALLAVITQEVGTVFKPLLKGVVGTEVGLSLMIPTLLGLALLKHDQNLAMALLADNVLFGLKDMVRPKKLKGKQESENDQVADPLVISPEHLPMELEQLAHLSSFEQVSRFPELLPDMPNVSPLLSRVSELLPDVSPLLTRVRALLPDVPSMTNFFPQATASIEEILEEGRVDPLVLSEEHFVPEQAGLARLSSFAHLLSMRDIFSRVIVDEETFQREIARFANSVQISRLSEVLNNARPIFPNQNDVPLLLSATYVNEDGTAEDILSSLPEEMIIRATMPGIARSV